MIGPFSTTLVPLSSSSSVDRQVLINVEASAISPDERNSVLSLQKYTFTRRSDEEKKGSRSLDQIARTFSLLCAPQHFLAPAATVLEHKIWPVESCLKVLVPPKVFFLIYIVLVNLPRHTYLSQQLPDCTVKALTDRSARQQGCCFWFRHKQKHPSISLHSVAHYSILSKLPLFSVCFYFSELSSALLSVTVLPRERPQQSRAPALQVSGPWWERCTSVRGKGCRPMLICVSLLLTLTID